MVGHLSSCLVHRSTIQDATGVEDSATREQDRLRTMDVAAALYPKSRIGRDNHDGKDHRSEKAPIRHDLRSCRH